MHQLIAQKVQEFFGKYPPRTYHKGQILIHAQDNPAHIFYLTEGRVKQYDISYRGDEVVVNVFQPPSFFPMSYAINRTPNVYFFESETNIKLHLAPIEDVLDFLHSNPDVTFNLLARVYRGTDGLLGRLAHMMAGSAKSRVLYELLVEARRFGTERDGATVIAVHETDIGAQAGLARETVNREMKKLKSEGYISVGQDEIIINDIAQLTEQISREL